MRRFLRHLKAIQQCYVRMICIVPTPGHPSAARNRSCALGDFIHLGPVYVFKELWFNDLIMYMYVLAVVCNMTCVKGAIARTP